MKSIVVQLQKELGCEDLPLPEYQSPDASGLDLYAAVSDPTSIGPGEIKLVSTGIRISIPSGHEGQVRPRSGLALKHGIGVLNSPGTIDADYRGVVNVILFNFGKDPFILNRGDRIAQLVVTRVEKVTFQLLDTLDSSERASGGFGSTGVR